MTERPEELSNSIGVPTGARWLGIAWRRKWYLVLGLLCGLGYGWHKYSGEPPVYSASTLVLVIKKNPSETMAISRGDSGSPIDDYLSEHKVLIKSPLIVRKAVKIGNLQELKSFAGLQDPTPAIIGGLSIGRDSSATSVQASHMLRLSFTGDDPEDCLVVLNAVVAAYKEFLDETYRSVGDETVKLIGEARNVLQKDLVRKAKEYEDFRQNAPLVTRGKEGTTIQQETLTSVQSAVSALLLRKAKAQGTHRAIESALRKGHSPETLATLLGDLVAASAAEGNGTSTVTATQKELLPLLNQEKELLERYGPDHRLVTALRSKINAMLDRMANPDLAWNQATRHLSDGDRTQLMKNLVERQMQIIKQQIEKMEEEETALNDLSNKLQMEARKLVIYEIQNESMKSDTVRTQQLYDSVLQRLNEVNLVKDMGGFATQVVFPPERGSRELSNATNKIFTATMLGLIAGVVMMSLAEFYDHSFRTPEEISRLLGLTVVGHIPEMKPSVKSVPPRADGKPGLDPMLLAYHHPRSPETEAFRGVRTALYFSKHGQKVLQITSADVGDGKTTLASNLAVCMAQSGKKVLLIDADFRKGRMHHIFGLSNEAGLATVLAGQSEVASSIQMTAVPDLFLMPTGGVPPNPAELLTSPRLKDVLDLLRGEFDFVLIDTPPLLAVSDPAVVAPRVDGVLLVVCISHGGGRHNAKRAVEMLAALGVRLLDVVVNGVHPVHRYGSYAYQSYDRYNTNTLSTDWARALKEAADRPLTTTPGEGQKTSSLISLIERKYGIPDRPNAGSKPPARPE